MGERSARLLLLLDLDLRSRSRSTLLLLLLLLDYNNNNNATATHRVGCWGRSRVVSPVLSWLGGSFPPPSCRGSFGSVDTSCFCGGPFSYSYSSIRVFHSKFAHRIARLRSNGDVSSPASRVRTSGHREIEPTDGWVCMGLFCSTAIVLWHDEGRAHARLN